MAEMQSSCFIRENEFVENLKCGLSCYFMYSFSVSLAEHMANESFRILFT